MNQNIEDVCRQYKNKRRNSTIKKLIKIIIITFSIILANILLIFNSANAISLNSANIQSGGDCGSLLIHKGIYIKAYYAEYIQDGISYPAYCLDKTKKGVSDELSYTVSIEDTLKDVELWKIIINGYPYKTIQELGCLNKEEAFTATKQAIYCYIHGNNPNDYTPIGEAGQRTLNALNKILDSAKNSKEIQISNSISINKENTEFTQDSIDKNYLSKTYSISAQGNISNYTVTLDSEEELPEGILITDIQNIEKQTFNQNEEFKILIPIKNLKNDGTFNINVKTKIDSKPVFYGKAPDSSYQDYALTASSYEDAKGNIKDTYSKNNTKIIVIKQDKDTKQRLEGVEFQLLNEQKQIIYTNLKTDEKGEFEIENLLPGKYYLKEINTKDGYIIDNSLISIETKLNQKLTITVNNQYEEEPEKVIEEENIEETITNTKKLPVTGN